MKNLNAELKTSLAISSPPLITLILRGRWDKTALQVAREIVINTDFEWDNFRRFVDNESLTPLLYRILRNEDWLPENIQTEWRNAYYKNACRNTLLLRELGKVLQSLADVGVDVIVLKGAALAEKVYGDIAARQMVDLDLLIKPEDLAIVRQVVANLGYKLAGVEMQSGFNEEFRNEEIHWKQGLINVVLDLHWKLVSPAYYQRTFLTDWFWETAIKTKISGSPALILGNEAQIVYLSAHLMLHHGGNSLLWFHDIAEAIAFSPTAIDWDLVIKKAQTYNLVLSVQQVLLRIADEWKVEIPGKVRSQLAILKPSWAEVRAYSWQNQIMALRLFDDLAGAKDWLTRLHIAWDTLFPSRAYMQHRYQIPHPLLIPFYYPYRWLRGLRKVSS
ncbi:nucleotidyltransferase family protein [Aerosakkonemataceae cyanobacterium BLCC-F154]|uniref:Nucleotidyltransferase family protein n=1 Tax=Floridaenema fluviatile BLCC-F154 TaxID=3153640 RepID=A0ABV4YBU3_9CYAN